MYSGSIAFTLPLLPRTEIPPSPRHFQFRRLLPLRRRSYQPIPQREQAIRRSYLWRAVHHLPRSWNRHDETGRKGSRIPQS